MSTIIRITAYFTIFNFFFEHIYQPCFFSLFVVYIQRPSKGMLFLEQLLTFEENGKKVLFKPQPFSPWLIYLKFQKSN